MKIMLPFYETVFWQWVHIVEHSQDRRGVEHALPFRLVTGTRAVVQLHSLVQL